MLKFGAFETEKKGKICLAGFFWTYGFFSLPDFTTAELVTCCIQLISVFVNIIVK